MPMQHARIYRAWLPSVIYSLLFSPILQHHRTNKLSKKHLQCHQQEKRRKKSTRMGEALLRKVRTLRICMLIKTIVPIVYECERIWPLCAFWLSWFVLSGLSSAQLKRVNGHKSTREPHRKEEKHNLSEVSWIVFVLFFFSNPLTFVDLRKK